VNEFVDGDVYRWGALMAGALAGSLPLLILYAFFVEHYVSAITGGVKEEAQGSAISKNNKEVALARSGSWGCRHDRPQIGGPIVARWAPRQVRHHKDDAPRRGGARETGEGGLSGCGRRRRFCRVRCGGKAHR